ncbi:MAG: glutathione peroxidase [Alcanivoracaceae bacterium]|nr:glutathione peroxidase [Alcanivoracaceae bacterium]
MSTVYDFSAASLTGKDINFEQYRGKVLLIVNTASKCGFTPQYKGLQELFAQYKEKGLEVLGFPCNQFGKQEPGEGEQISEFCEVNYGVDFQMFSKIDVNGDGTHPLYQHLKAEAPGLLGSKAIKWNFTKFLVGKDGKVVKRYAPTDTPASIEKDIAKLL